MDAEALAGGRSAFCIGEQVCELHLTGGMRDAVITHSDVGDRPAERADVRRLVPWREENRKPHLRKSAPGVFQNIALEEHALGVLQFEVVLDDKRLARSSANEASLMGIHINGLAQEVVADFDVGRSRGGGTASEEQRFLPRPCGSFPLVAEAWPIPARRDPLPADVPVRRVAA